MTNQVVQLRASVEQMLVGGRREGIEPDGPLGLWLGAQADALAALASLLEGQTARVEASLAAAREAGDIHARRVEATLAEARAVLDEAQLALSHARSAQLFLHTSQESLVARMIDDTLPLFAQRMKEVLVIRETAWNRDQARRRYVAAGAIVLAVFLSGFGVRGWSEAALTGLGERCASHLEQVNGRTMCALSAVAPQ